MEALRGINLTIAALRLIVKLGDDKSKTIAQQALDDAVSRIKSKT